MLVCSRPAFVNDLSPIWNVTLEQSKGDNCILLFSLSAVESADNDSGRVPKHSFEALQICRHSSFQFLDSVPCLFEKDI